MKSLLGEYYPADSFWHRADPRAKLLLTVGVTLPLFTSRGWEVAALAAGFLLAWLTARLPWRLFGQTLWAFRWLFGLTLALTLFFPFDPRQPLAIPNERSLLAVTLLGRLALLFGLAAWLGHTTLPGRMLAALERLLRPLRLLGAAPADWAFTVMLALRFLPELLVDWEQINAVQRLRSGKHIIRLDMLQSLAVPAFAMSIRRAAAISTALVARGYRPGAARTEMEPLSLRAADWGVFILALGILAFFAVRTSV